MTTFKKLPTSKPMRPAKQINTIGEDWNNCSMLRYLIKKARQFAAPIQLAERSADRLAHLEDGEIHCYHHAADECAEYHHDDGFHQAG